MGEDRFVEFGQSESLQVQLEGRFPRLREGRAIRTYRQYGYRLVRVDRGRSDVLHSEGRCAVFDPRTSGRRISVLGFVGGPAQADPGGAGVREPRRPFPPASSRGAATEPNV